MDSKGVVQIMMESFGADLIEQLRRNLGDAFQAVSGENLDWGALLVQILGQLLVSVIYLGVFLGVYLILIAAIRLGLGERRTKTPLYIQMRSGLRYLADLVDRAPPSTHALPTQSRSCSVASCACPATATPLPSHAPCSAQRFLAETVTSHCRMPRSRPVPKT